MYRDFDGMMRRAGLWSNKVVRCPWPNRVGSISVDGEET